MQIDETLINSLLEKNNITDNKIDLILDKALELKGLGSEDVAGLINISKKEHLDKLFKTAARIKNDIYGNRLVLFAPLYISNYCANNCLYCGFRKDNQDMKRQSLTRDEIKEDVKIILSQGHKRILMLMGEHPDKCSLDYFIKAIEAAYSVKDSYGSSLRRINIEIAPLTESEFKKLSRVKIGTYTVFQETYHRETYKKMHPSGQKADYESRLNTMDRAFENGMHDVGIGALFGLYDYRFEVLALIQHADELDKKYGVGPHTISVPRIEPAQNAPAASNVPKPVSDIDFKKVVAVLRCAVPYTGIILSTRESPEMRTSLFNLGVSQISAGSKTSPGGYKKSQKKEEKKESPDVSQSESRDPDSHVGNEEQFSLNDTRSTGEVIKSVIKQGFIPSFCTGCYRKGRVGKDFMDLAKPGLIKLFCVPNSLTTFQEYLEDYADDETKIQGEKIIKQELGRIPNKKTLKQTKDFLARIKKGERDLYF